jgi:hypothetical protein
MPNYAKSKIYKIVCNITGETYYGSTTQTLAQRITGHRYGASKNKYTSREIIERGDYDYVLCEECPCENKEQLHAIERKYIDENECVNKKIPNRTHAEYFKANKEYFKQKAKENREKNKQQIYEREKEYREINKEHIKAKKQQRCICECGISIQQQTKYIHLKSEKHKTNMLNLN